jgi:hypothetical protein
MLSRKVSDQRLGGSGDMAKFGHMDCGVLLRVTRGGEFARGQTIDLV